MTATSALVQFEYNPRRMEYKPWEPTPEATGDNSALPKFERVLLRFNQNFNSLPPRVQNAAIHSCGMYTAACALRSAAQDAVDHFNPEEVQDGLIEPLSRESYTYLANLREVVVLAGKASDLWEKLFNKFKTESWHVSAAGFSDRGNLTGLQDKLKVVNSALEMLARKT